MTGDFVGNAHQTDLQAVQVLRVVDDAELKATFATVATELAANEQKIVDELNAAQGSAVELGGYYRPSAELLAKAMRPSNTLNGILATIG